MKIYTLDIYQDVPFPEIVVGTIGLSGYERGYLRDEGFQQHAVSSEVIYYRMHKERLDEFIEALEETKVKAVQIPEFKFRIIKADVTPQQLRELKEVTEAHYRVGELLVMWTSRHTIYEFLKK